MTEDTGKQWTELYHENADEDESLMPSEPLPFVDGVTALLDEYGHETVLEAAVGEGRNSQKFAKSISNLYGCDISEEALGVCAERTDGEITTRQADVRSLPYDNGQFDATIMLDALTHLREVELVLRELIRVTADGGHVIFNMPVEGDDAGSTSELIANWGVLREYEYRKEGHHVTYMFVGDQKRFTTLLSAFDLQIERVTTWEWRDPPHPQYRLEEHSHKNIVVYARK
ncbi:hypothetical protein DMJ13_23165 [halophilic archaeon]|nr:hypothetical protein DMJ13_23165 [halophilic archaeon]